MLYVLRNNGACALRRRSDSTRQHATRPLSALSGGWLGAAGAERQGGRVTRRTWALVASLLGACIALATSPAAGVADDKVTVCHKSKTLSVPAGTLERHVSHGDAVGRCDSASTPATAYHGNAAHTGATADAVSAAPSRAWSRDLGGATSYPVIADGRVFVTVSNSNGYGTKLHALDASTGATSWGPVDLDGTYFWSALTYDAGQIYALNYDGVLRAFDAATGVPRWATQLAGQYAFSSAPTAYGGYVYAGGAGSGGTVYAVEQASGTIAWTQPVANGDESSPAVSSSGVYVSYACGQSYAFAPLSGAPLWHRPTGCSGGGGKTPVLAHGELYVRDFLYPAVLDAASGAELRPFESSVPVPAVDGTSRYVLANSTLRAESLSPQATRWTFTGDGALSSAPLVAGGTVFVGSATGNLYALSSDSGAVTWSTNVGSSIPAPDEHNVSQPLTGLATSGGLLVVPAGSTLVAYR